ncbi:MAG: hypothetical protein EOM59_10545 [Clostridia bacterium]|nr:hypothetical protein [Clostridia bacterium]
MIKFRLLEMQIVPIENCEKLSSKRNDVLRCDNRVIKHFISHDDYTRESLIYAQLSETGLAPKILQQQDDCITTEYIEGILLFDALEKTLHNESEQIRLFELFFEWHIHFQRQTNCILGDTNLKNFILSEGALYGLDFETCKEGHPVEDFVWQTAMLATLRPAFSSERKAMARLFLSMSMQHVELFSESLPEILLESFQAICKRRQVEMDFAALKEISSSVEVAVCLLAGGKSSRMGTDKKLLRFGEDTMLTSTANDLNLYSAKYLSFASKETALEIEGFQNVFDSKPNCGPIGGIVSALKEIKQEWTLFISCDMPLVQRELIDYLLAFRDKSYDAIMFSENGKARILPLLVRTETARPAFIHALENNAYALWRTVEDFPQTLKVKAEDCPFYQHSSLKNINTKEDYEELKSLEQKK